MRMKRPSAAHSKPTRPRCVAAPWRQSGKPALAQAETVHPDVHRTRARSPRNRPRTPGSIPVSGASRISRPQRAAARDGTLQPVAADEGILRRARRVGLRRGTAGMFDPAVVAPVVDVLAELRGGRPRPRVRDRHRPDRASARGAGRARRRHRRLARRWWPGCVRSRAERTSRSRWATSRRHASRASSRSSTSCSTRSSTSSRRMHRSRASRTPPPTCGAADGS